MYIYIYIYNNIYIYVFIIHTYTSYTLSKYNKTHFPVIINFLMTSSKKIVKKLFSKHSLS